MLDHPHREPQPSLLGAVVHGYCLLELLGHGSSSSVYRASGRDDASQVAVKLLQQAEGADLYRRVQFEHEASLLARLAHPGIVRLLGHGTHQARPYLVTELAPGRSLAQLIADRGAQDAAFVAETLRQVALALAHAHGHRILHRDIKPSNIVVAEADDGALTAKLLDFGFGHLQGVGTAAAAAAGTFLYMSPEQLGILTVPPDERSDLYALGIVAVELLVGRHPYVGLDLRDLIHAHAALVPALPPEAPAALAQIVALLVRKDPADRYRSAAGVAADLDLFLARHRSGDDGTFVLRTHDRQSELVAPGYFGRSAERAALTDAYAASKRGLQIVAVAGVSGIGKTRLIGEAARAWSLSLVLSGRGRAFGQTSGYGLIAEALRTLAGQPLTGAMQAAMRDAVGNMGGEVLALVPELKLLLGDAVSIAPLKPEHQQQRLFTLIAAMLSTLGESNAPLVLILDDLQWADDGSLQFVLHLAKRTEPRTLLLVLAWRAEEVPAGSRVAQWLDQVRAARAVTLIALEPLSVTDVRTMIASMLDSEVPGVAEAVAAQAQGHPLHAIELTHGLVECGTLLHQANGWALDAVQAAKLARDTDTLAETIVRRLDRLDASERDVLTIAAVVGRGFNSEVVRRVWQAETSAEAEPAARRTVSAQMAAEAAQLIVPSAQPGAYTFAHDKIREALVDALPVDRRERLHELIGDVLGEQDGDGNAQVYGRAHHYARAGSAAKAASAAMRAGRLARHQYAHLEALEFYAHAAHWAATLPASERDALVPNLAELIADSQAVTGQLDAALEAYQALLAQPGSLAAQVGRRRKLSRLMFVRGQNLRATGLLEEALAMLGESVPKSTGGVLWQIVREALVQTVHTLLPRVGPINEDPRWTMLGEAYSNLAQFYASYDMTRALAASIRNLNLLEKHRADRALTAAYSIHGAGCVLGSFLKRGARYGERALALCRAQSDRWGAAEVQYLLSLALISDARWEEGLAHARACTAEFEQQGDTYLLNASLILLSRCLAFIGRWDEAERVAQRTLRIASAIDESIGLAYSFMGLGELVARSELPAVLQSADDVLKRLEGNTDRQCICSVLRVKGNALQFQGRLLEAEAVLAEGSRLVYRSSYRIFLLIDMLPDHAHVLLRLAREASSAEERARWLKRAKTVLRRAQIYLAGLPTTRATLLRARARAAWLSGRHASAEALWRRAQIAASELGMVYQRALCAAEWGTALRSSDPQRSTNLLAEACDLFVKLGARHELARWGLSADVIVEMPGRDVDESLPAVGDSQGTGGSGAREAVETERIRALVGIARQLSATHDVNRLLQAIVDSAAQLLGAERGTLYLWDSKRTRYERHTGFGSAEALAIPVSTSVLDSVLRNGEGVLFADAQSDPGLDAAPSVVSSGARSVLCAPLRYQDQVLGAIYLDNRLMRGLFAPKDLELLQALASQAAVSLHNTTLYEQLEEKVRARTKEAEDARHVAESATRAKGDFLANMSHEIRTPMNAILGMSHLALESGLDARQHNYVAKVERSAQSLLGLINDILDFSKIEAGKLDMEAVEFSFGEMMSDLTDLLALKAQDKGVELLYDVAPGLPETLIGDPLRLRQVLVNLGGNAIKFTERGEVTVHVEPIERTTTTAVLRFNVRDTGPGMTEDQRLALFRPFMQADSSISRRYGGTGLGLAISRQLVELMHGSIGVDSAPAQGSSFHFSARFALPATAARTPDYGPAPATDLLGLRALIVDDNAAARALLVQMAEALGMQAESATDGWDALRIVTLAAHAGGTKGASRGSSNGSSGPAMPTAFDLVLIDRAMPAMDGIECAAQLQPRMSTGQGIVLMSAPHEREAVEVRLAERGVGAAAWMAKPALPSDMLQACLGALGHGLTANAARVRESEPAVPRQQWQGSRILLVEDNEINQEIALELLGNAGLAVTVAADGRQALAMLADADFDAVLMDCQMPVMDGYEATREIRKQVRWSSLPIIAMTANAMSGDREKALQAGMNDHIVKPIVIKQMFETIERWVR